MTRLASLEGLVQLLKDDMFMGHCETRHPKLSSCRLELRGDLVAVELRPAQRMTVQVSESPPWEIRKPGTYFWNYSDHGALWGSIKQGDGHFTRHLQSDGSFPVLPLPVMIHEGEARYMIQGVTLDGNELSYVRLLVPRKPNTSMLTHFVNHLGLGSKPYVAFAEARQAMLALRRDWR